MVVKFISVYDALPCFWFAYESDINLFLNHTSVQNDNDSTVIQMHNRWSICLQKWREGL